MTEQEQASVAKMVSTVAKIYGHTLDNDVLAINVRILNKYPFAAVMGALQQVAEDPRVNKSNLLPIAHHVRQRLEPKLDDRDEAMEAASRAIAALSKFGYTNPDRAKEFIGELGWEAIRLMGGWTRLCETTTPDQNEILRAQLRDLCVSVSKKSRAGLSDTPPQLPTPNPFLQIRAKSMNEQIGWNEKGERF